MTFRSLVTAACLGALWATQATAASPLDLARRIDERLAARWRAEKVAPAAPTDDGAFLRRAYLDLVGQVPTITEVRDFLDDTAPDKRARLVDHLLTTEAHARHFASLWRKLLIAEANPFIVGQAAPLEGWLAQQFKDNGGYDRLVKALLTAPQGDPMLVSYFQANENKPETLAASATRVFLGVRLECAQCHDHPFAKWKRAQFWETAAFFSDVRPLGQPAPKRRGEITIANSDRVVRARFLTGEKFILDDTTDPRASLANWLVNKDNPYFARATINRVWAHFFGMGIIDPIESLGEEGAPSHPELLDELARTFATEGFDLRFLVRAITASKAYALSSTGTTAARETPRLFARAAVRGLTAEQLFDSLAVVTGEGSPLDGTRAPFPVRPERFAQRTEFLARFSSQDRPVDAQTSILQALHLMNGKRTEAATSLAGNRLLRTVAESRGRTNAQRIEELYLVVLARKPRPAELSRLVRYVDAGGARNDPREALADVLWALLNSPDFALNH